ncbi:MAG: xanthine dehydrogenase family protein molybdopterin-binding subunit [Candidatus Acidiferrales bacterium]
MAQSAPANLIGTSVARIDGPLKTTGTAKYTSDHNFPNMVHAIPVQSPIGKGKITAMDVSAAEKMPGVLRIYRFGHLPHLYRAHGDDFDAHVDETRPPFEDEVIYYNGQYVAVVFAETVEQARAAARAVRVEYTPDTPNVALDLSDGFHDKMKEISKRGDVDSGFASAPVKIDQTYVTPIETHNPIELHATVATWDGEQYKLYETTQSIMNHQSAMAQMLGVPREDVQIVMKFLGSGFGGKLWPWTHDVLAAAGARDLNRPVKLVIERRMMFSNVGHRPRTQQRIKLAATPDGKLTCLQHDYVSDTSILDEVSEDCGEATPYIYSTPNLRVRGNMVTRNVGTPTAMRGPGAVPGLYALESGMDELAVALKIDPVQLRLTNEPEIDESNGRPFSSRHLKECLTTGAEKFGWSKRNPAVGSMKRGDLTLGWGVACASWIAMRMPCKTSLQLNDDGSARISCATQDIGTGTYTIFAQVVNAKTGVPIDKIHVVLGDSSLPPGPISGGSWVTGTVIPSIANAADNAVKQLLDVAVNGTNSPFHRRDPKELEFSGGRIRLKSDPASTGIAFDELLRKGDLRYVEGLGDSMASFQDPNANKYSLHSYGAQFAEVEWDPGIARLRVSRVVSVIDVGKVMNPRPARNQVEGAIVMGIGMGLFEETHYDPRNARPLNCNLADYIMTTSADCPEIDVTFLDYPDLVLNEFGARGVGEIGLAGVAPAITAAVYHATGVRVRELPVRIEDLMATGATAERV